MKRGLALATLFAVLALSLGAPVAATDHEEPAPPEPILWISFLKSPPGGGQALIQNIIAEDSGIWGQLLADGKIVEWGIAQPITHRGDDPYNVAEWATFTSWEAVDAFVAGFMAKQAAKSPEELAASREAYLSVTVPGSHYDYVNEVVHAATNGERPGYISVGFQRARPGHERDLTELWQTHVQPMYEKLMAEGAIQGFGLFTPALHGDPSWTHASWSAMPGLAGISAQNKAFAEIQPEAIGRLMEVADWEAHWDEILAVVHYENAADQ